MRDDGELISGEKKRGREREIGREIEREGGRKREREREREGGGDRGSEKGRDRERGRARECKVDNRHGKEGIMMVEMDDVIERWKRRR